jgi:ABC-2 type transport system permease protein
LIGERLTGEQWGQLATASALWILLPLVLGLIRLTRSELK